MAKRRKKSNSQKSKDRLDRISSLPKPLLHHILSYLPSQYVVRTCVLSKSWKNIWCSIPTLELDQHEFSRVQRFYKFGDSLLIRRDGSNLQKLHLEIYQRLDYGSDSDDDDDIKKTDAVNAWIIYAMRHNVEVLHIGNSSYSALTPQMFTCESLRELRLYTDDPFLVKLPSSICLPALKVLHLVYSNDDFMTDYDLSETLSAIPSLETFILDCSFLFQKLTVSQPQLKHLIFKGEVPSLLEITAPNLVYLQLNQSIHGQVNPWMYKKEKTIRFKTNPIHLTNAYINLPPSCFGSTANFFATLQNTHSLTLSSYFLSTFSATLESDISVPECVQDPFNNLKWLKFDTVFNDSEIQAVSIILKYFPKVETIFLENSKGGMYYDDYSDNVNREEEQTETEKLSFGCKLDHLKLVEFRHFRGSVNEVKLIKFILESSIVLEKLIISTLKCSSRNEHKMMTIGRELLTYRRASPNVGILFGYKVMIEEKNYLHTGRALPSVGTA